VDSHSFSLVVITSDGYSSLLDGFIFFYNKYSDLPDTKVYIALENDYRESFSNFIFFTTSSSNWSSRVHKILERLDSEYVYLMPEDFYMQHAIDINKLDSVLRFCIKNEVDFIGPLYLHENITFIEDDSDIKFYRINNNFIKNYKYLFAGSGIYKRSFLLKLLRSNENIWEFELNSSFRVNQKKVNNYRYSSNIDPLAVYPPGIISRGELTTLGKEFLDDHNYTINWMSKQKMVTTSDDSILKRIIRIPPRYSKLLINIFFNKL
jgi:hypothetical protein